MRLFDMVACLQSRASYWKIGPLIESLKSILFSIFFLAGNERIRHCKCLENFRCECSLQSLYQSKPDLCFLEWIKTKRYLLAHIANNNNLFEYSSQIFIEYVSCAIIRVVLCVSLCVCVKYKGVHRNGKAFTSRHQAREYLFCVASADWVFAIHSSTHTYDKKNEAPSTSITCMTFPMTLL